MWDVDFIWGKVLQNPILCWIDQSNEYRKWAAGYDKFDITVIDTNSLKCHTSVETHKTYLQIQKCSTNNDACIHFQLTEVVILKTFWERVENTFFSIILRVSQLLSKGRNNIHSKII